jgi:hypothetical protein
VRATKEVPVSDSKFASILAAALAAGIAAGAAAVPTPMIVSGHGISEFVSDGVCGFGWVEFPGNTAFGRWAKRNGHARSGYPKGLSIWSKLMTQSLARNEAWAEGVADVLRSHGIAASAKSRID